VAISCSHTTGREAPAKVVDELRRTTRLTLSADVASNTGRPGLPAESFTHSGADLHDPEPSGTVDALKPVLPSADRPRPCRCQSGALWPRSAAVAVATAS